MSVQQPMGVDMLLADNNNLNRFLSESKKEEADAADSFTMDDLPLFGREVSCDGLAFLSRENSASFSLSREVSASFARENSVPFGREISVSYLIENTATLSRENSQALARESSCDFTRLIASANVHDFLRESDAGASAVRDAHTAAADAEPASADPDFMAVIANLELPSHTTADTALRNPAHASSAAGYGTAPTRRGDGAPRGAKASKRGLHVKDRPEMQQTARDGAVHWAQQLKHVRAAWAARAAASPAFHDAFQGQIDQSLGRVKSKQECLLRILHFAAADGLIVAGASAAAAGPAGFFGWTRFDVVPARAGEFRRAVESLFPAGFREDTVKETFRRAGLVPERWQWALGWAGHAPWVFTPKPGR